MPVTSFELFRRIAHDAISTPFLVPDDERSPPMPRSARDRGLCDTRRRDVGRTPPRCTAEDLAAATGGRLLRRSDRPIRGAAVDSRLVEPGQLFVALAGERTDGHRYLAEAAAAGAAALLVGRPPDADAGERRSTPSATSPSSCVADPLRALHADRGGLALAGSTRWSSASPAASPRPRPRRPSRACSSGRLRHAPHRGQPEQRDRPAADGAAARARARRRGPRDGHVRRRRDPRARAIGRPPIGIVTAVQPVHLSRIGSIEAIEDAKAELVEALPAAATAASRSSTPTTSACAGWPRARAPARRPTASPTDADVRADDVVSRGLRRA